MINAYDELYVERAQMTLGCMLDYAVNDLKIVLRKFYELFLASVYSSRFEKGDPGCIAGCSGAELALKILDYAGLTTEPVACVYKEGRSREYWTGWALAYYQWNEAESFRRIDQYMPVDKIRDMYEPYHEMDLRQFSDTCRERKEAFSEKTSLARLRKYAELSQCMLANISSVPVRSIQQYEQRQKKIEKAGADQLVKLGRALGCSIEELICI